MSHGFLPPQLGRYATLESSERFQDSARVCTWHAALFLGDAAELCGWCSMPGRVGEPSPGDRAARGRQSESAPRSSERRHRPLAARGNRALPNPAEPEPTRGAGAPDPRLQAPGQAVRGLGFSWSPGSGAWSLCHPAQDFAPKGLTRIIHALSCCGARCRACGRRARSLAPATYHQYASARSSCARPPQLRPRAPRDGDRMNNPG
jgi:hypothetical protein